MEIISDVCGKIEDVFACKLFGVSGVLGFSLNAQVNSWTEIRTFILFYFILFYSILFYSILFYSILFIISNDIVVDVIAFLPFNCLTIIDLIYSY